MDIMKHIWNVYGNFTEKEVTTLKASFTIEALGRREQKYM
jgi:hypothetical protein